MSILVLSARPETPSNRRLQQAAGRLGAELAVVDALKLTVDGRGVVRCGSAPLPKGLPTVLLARVGNWRPDSMLAIAEALAAAGAVAVNPVHAIRVGRDHWQTMTVLTAAGLPVPTTLAGADPEALARDAAAELGFPVVVKQRRSRMGVGVIRCDAADHLEAVLDSLWRVGDEVVVQEYIPSGGSSLRLLVAGDRVVAAARFSARSGEWRSNAARGGRAAAVEIDDATADLAVRAARTVGLGLCGVDLLPSAAGVVVGELNPSPGFTALEAASGVDVAAAIVTHLCELGAGATRRP